MFKVIVIVIYYIAIVIVPMSDYCMVGDFLYLYTVNEEKLFEAGWLFAEFYTGILSGRENNPSCTLPLGGVGVCSSRKVLNFRPFEVASKAPEGLLVVVEILLYEALLSWSG